jgi:hypothetical protein
MSTCCDPSAEEIATLRALIAAFDAALLALAGGKQSYQVDTGQTRILVTKANLATVRDTRNDLKNELALLCGSGSTHIVPGF